MTSRLSREYRDDEEMYVDDQCCSNCANEGREACPFYMSEFEQRVTVKREIEKRMREDAIITGGKPKWCIYWQQRWRKRWKH